MANIHHALPPPENVKSAERRFWRNYNEEADKYDEVLTKSWKGDMDSILIFAGLFSAALTAFIVESYQKLEPDSGDQAVLILKQLLLVQTALASGHSSPAPLSSPASVIPHFRPPTSILICNIFWFLSLSFSLASALAATLVQQWIRSYLQDSRDTSPIMHAKIRMYLHDGIKDFKMNRIVGVIPTLLHISLFLFYAGVIAFFYNINTVIAGLHVAIIACVLLVYSFMTLLALLHRRSPFSTPVAHFFWWLIGIFYKFFINHYQKPEGPPKASLDVVDAADELTVVRTTAARQSIRYRIIKNLNRLLTPYDESRRDAAKETKEANCKRERQAFTWYLNTCSEDSEFEKFVELFPLTYQEEKSKEILYPIMLQQSGFSVVGRRLPRRILDLFRTCTDALGAERHARRVEICTLAIEWIISIQPEISQLETWKMEAYSLLSRSISSGDLNISRCSHLLPLVIMLTQLDTVFNLLVKFSPNINNYSGDADHPHEGFTDLLSKSLLDNWKDMKSERQFLIGHLIQAFPLEYKIVGCFELITVLLESFCDQSKLFFSNPGSYVPLSSSSIHGPAHYLQFFQNAALELSKLNTNSELTVQNLDQYLEKILSLPALRLNVSMFRKGLGLCKAARHRDFTSYQIQFSQIHKKATFLAALAVCHPHVRPPNQPCSLPATYRAMDLELLRSLININESKKLSLSREQINQVADETSVQYMEIIDSLMSSGTPKLSDSPVGTNHAMDLLLRIEEKFQTKGKSSLEPPLDDTKKFMSKTIEKIKEELEKRTENAQKEVTAVSNLETLHAELPFSIYHSDVDDKSDAATETDISSESGPSVEAVPVQSPGNIMFGNDYPESYPNLSISTSGLSRDTAGSKNQENGTEIHDNYASSSNASEVEEEKGSPQSPMLQRKSSRSLAGKPSFRSMRATQNGTTGVRNSDVRLQNSRPQNSRRNVSFKAVHEDPDTDSSGKSEGSEKATRDMQTVAIHGRDGTTETFFISDSDG